VASVNSSVAGRPIPNHRATRARPAWRSLEEGLFRLRIRVLWAEMRKEPLAFWFLSAYVVVEYLRPQRIYPVLDTLPWGRVSIAACLVAVLFGRGFKRSFHSMDGLVAAFFFWVVLSCIFAFNPYASWEAWEEFVSWPILYFLVTHIVLNPKRLFLYWLGFFVVNLKMSQHGARTFIHRGFSFSAWGATGSPGWFQNSGEFAMQMVGFLAMSWCFFIALKPFLSRNRLWLMLAIFPATAVLSVMASSSRGGQLAAGIVFLALALVHKVRIRTLVAGAMAVWIGWLALPAEQKARFETMGEDDTSQARLTLWREARQVVAAHPVFGIGYANWRPYHQARTGREGEVVHNTVLEAASELGYPGAAMFLALVGMTWITNRRTRRRARRLGEWGRVFRGMAIGLDLALLGFFVAAQFMSVLFYPIFWMLFAMTTSLSEVSRRMKVGVRKRRRVRPGQGSMPVAAPALHG